MADLEKLVEQLSALSVLEAAELVKKLEEKWGVSAAAPVAVPLGILQGVDLRARKEGFVRFRDEAALDPYLFTRDSYLQHREFQILDGKSQRRSIYDEPLEPMPSPVTPAK